MAKWVVREGNVFWPSEEMKKVANISNSDVYEEADKNPVSFWEEKARELKWFKEWEKPYEENLPYFKWFIGGKINMSYNCLDVHLKDKGDKPAIIWEPEPPHGEARIITYNELYKEVNKFSNVLKKLGVKKGDRVGIYLPMIPEVQMAMLACARIGAIHTVVFSAFSPDSLRHRLNDSGAKILITSDGYYRRGKEITLKDKADEGIKDTGIEKVIVVRRTGSNVNMADGRDFYLDELMKDAEEYCEPEKMESNDTLFLLYTSGTTGKPKGVIHDTGGYAVQAYLTTKWIFDLKDDDIFWCTADIGWVTGHTYSCYGPLLCGGTMLVYEGSPDYPDPGVWWKLIEKHKVTIFYTSPTAIRMFERTGESWMKKYDLSSLRLLGSVGEPIGEEAWMWYFENVGGGRCPIVDTWWQTETGGILISSLPGIGPIIPTFAGKSFPGVRMAVVDESGNELGDEKPGYLVQKSPFAPGMLRGVYGNPEKYKKTYWEKYKTMYDTSDGAYIKNGLIKIEGRTDDVMKVAGHRLSTAELEDTITLHENVVECAVVPRPDEIKGEAPVAFVILRGKEREGLKEDIIKLVERKISPIAKPAEIYFVDDLPKTRSGKIMRRILRNLISGKELGDITTLVNPESVEKIKEKLKL
ncbi:MAG: acetate--CoA ligase [Candidatus Aenigmarchaeota archaeon]|nr:acetate--CoA ligase [Candidatus Aenigmarchaeota archaeon]